MKTIKWPIVMICAAVAFWIFVIERREEVKAEQRSPAPLLKAPTDTFHKQVQKSAVQVLAVAPVDQPKPASARQKIMQIEAQTPILTDQGPQPSETLESLALRLQPTDLPELRTMALDSNTAFRARFFALQAISLSPQTDTRSAALIAIASSPTVALPKDADAHSFEVLQLGREVILRKLALDGIAQSSDASQASLAIQQVLKTQNHTVLRSVATRMLPYVESGRFAEYRAREDAVLKKAAGEQPW